MSSTRAFEFTSSSAVKRLHQSCQKICNISFLYKRGRQNARVRSLRDFSYVFWLVTEWDLGILLQKIYWWHLLHITILWMEIHNVRPRFHGWLLEKRKHDDWHFTVSGKLFTCNSYITNCKYGLTHVAYLASNCQLLVGKLQT